MVTKTTKHIVLGLSLGLLTAGCSSFQKTAVAGQMQGGESRPAVGPRHVGPEFQVKWAKPTVEGSFKLHRKMNRMTPVVNGSLVIQGNNLSDLVAFDRETGRQVWRKQFKGGVEAGALQFKDRLFVTTNNGTVVALDVWTGRDIWSFATSSENVSAPVLDSQTGRLYFQNAQNMVFCLDAENGKQIWVYSKNDAALLTIRGAATPTLSQGRVYAGLSDGSFVALTASGGQVIWDQGLNRNKKFRDIDAQAVIYKDLVIVSGYEDKIYALDAVKGNVIWSYPMGSSVAATLVGSDVIVGSTNGAVIKLKADTGDLVWSYPDVKGIPTQIAVYDQFAFFGESQGRLKVLNIESGKLLGSFEPGRGVYSMPFVDEAKSEVYFISGEAYLYSLRFSQNSVESFSFIQ